MSFLKKERNSDDLNTRMNVTDRYDLTLKSKGMNHFDYIHVAVYDIGSIKK